MQPVEIHAPDAELSFWPELITPQDCEFYYQQLLSGIQWRQDKITLFGKTFDLPRLQVWHGDQGMTYRYSGLELTPEPWIPVLLTLKESVEQACCSSFNTVLLNLYRDGNDSNGWHSDDETELGEQPVIASLSLGQERRFPTETQRWQIKRHSAIVTGFAFRLTAGDVWLNAELLAALHSQNFQNGFPPYQPDFQACHSWSEMSTKKIIETDQTELLSISVSTA